MSPEDRPELSIVIVNYRSWARLDRCLPTLPAAEIVVVDNASGDLRLPEFAKAHPGVRFVANDGNWGFADGCNCGAKEARGDLILFLNPDTEDRDGAVTALLAAARAHPEAAILTARQVDESGRPQKSYDAFPSLLTLFGATRALLRAFVPGRYPDARRDRAGYREVDWVSGSVLLIRREAFERLGGFYNRFWMYSEDVDLCKRARDAGLLVAYAGGATIVHAHGGDSRKDPATAALTRSEVVVSRHLYASRHFGAVHAGLYHAALVATRFLPAALAALAARVGFGSIRGIQVRAGMARHLARYYRRVPSTGWRSRRARS
jgi:GT2 family glycosyltransferase